MELPNKKYKIIYADPPWAYLWGKGKNGGNFSPEKHYPTMEIDEICSLPIRGIRDKNCAIFLWTTGPNIPLTERVMSAWGFKYKTIAFCWVKTRKDGVPLMGPGSYTRSNIEICCLGMRGHIKSISHSVPQIIMAKRTIHSQKPFEVSDRIVKLFGDLPRIELFARDKKDGWDYWGNEIS